MKTANSIFKTFLVALLLATQVHFAYAQTAALLPVAPQQFFDKNGNPVTSGSVGYYIPGTSTPKMVWQDDSQTTPWTNPITLNAGGWPPNNKGIYGNGTYRQIIKDKNQNIISDQPTSATGSGGGSGTSVGDGNSVGTILAWSGMIAPNQYQFAYGQSLSRATYPELYQAITLATDVVCVGGNATLTSITDTSNIPVGAALEGNCIVAGSTVISKTINTVTLSIAANISTTTNVRFFPYGNGNGTTTFNAPDLRGKVIPGRTNMGGVTASNLTNTYYGSNPDAVGANGGTQSSTLAQSDLPNVNFNVSIPSGQGSHNHSYAIANIGSAALQPGGAAIPYPISASANTGSTTLPALTGTAASGGSGTAFSLVQPSITLNYIIKVTPDTSISGLFGVASIGGMQGVIACGTGITCAGNIISVSAGGAGGSNTQVQFNNSGTLDGNSAFIWVSPKLTIGLNGSSTGQFALAGATSGVLTQTVGSIVGTPIVTWGNTSGTPAVTASSPLVLNTTTGNLTITGAALTKTDDTNVTLTLGGTPASSLLASTSLTLGWTGTLAAGRLNSNVVQSIVNDTNINGSISAQALTFSWAGTLAVQRGGTGVGSFTANNPIIGNGTSALSSGTRSGNTTVFATTTGALTPGDCVSIDANGNFVDAGTTCGGGGGGGSPGGANGTIQYNNAGAFGGFIASGDATINTSTGVVTNAKINGTSIPATPSANQIPVATSGTSAIWQSGPTWFDNAYCSTAGYLIARFTSSWTCAQQIPINIVWLGADKTGVVDAATLINSTISSLGTTGGTIVFEQGTYKIGSTLNLGNGTSASGSTQNNVILKGLAEPKTPPSLLGGYVTQTGGVTFLWSGGSSPMISVKGPLQGWGVEHVYLDCNATATIGLEIISGQFGKVNKLTTAGCPIAGIKSTTVSTFGAFTNTDSLKNRFDDVLISVPNTANAIGVWLTSNGTTANTDYNSFYNLTTWQLGTAASYGLYLAATDSNSFYFYKPVTTGGSNQAIAFDYSITAFWPAGNMFFGTEPATPINIGSPNGNSRPNYFYGVTEANGNFYPVSLPNAQSAVPSVIGGRISLTGQTAAIATSNLLPITPYSTGLYRINYYLDITTVGTAGTIGPQFAWLDNAQIQAAVPAAATTTAKNYVSGSLVIYATAGANINYQTNFAGVTGSPQYSLFITVEKLH